MTQVWSTPPRVVVGVDDSPAACWALTWAVGEARLRGLPLLIVHAIRPPRAGHLVANIPSPSDVATLQRDCADALRALLSDMSIPPELDVTIACPYGHPGATLAHLAHEGDLLVIGHAPRGPLHRLITRSVRGFWRRRARATLVIVPIPSPPALDTSTLRAGRAGQRRLSAGP